MNSINQDTKFIKFFIALYFLILCILISSSLLINKGQDVLLINSNHSSYLDSFFSLFTNLGDGIIFCPIILITLFIRFRDTISWALVAIVSGLIISLFKRLLFPMQGRPITYLSHDLLHFVPGVDVHSYSSFPSGHTATIFAMVTFLSLMSRNKNITLILAIVAVLVGYSRIYLLQHFLFDVAIGATIGSLTSLAVYFTFSRRQDVPAWMNGRIRIKFPDSKGMSPSNS